MEEPPQVTRRTIVGGLAAATVTSLLHPAAGVANALAESGSVWSRWIGSLSGTSPPVLAPHRFVLVGVEWQGPREAGIELRARGREGRWSPWATASTLGHGPDRPAGGAHAALFGEPLWTGPADQVQLRSDRPTHGLRLAFVAGTGPTGLPAAAANALPQALPVLDAGGGQPPIIARRAWANGHAPPRHKPQYGSIKLAFVHHTVNPNGYGGGEVPAMLRAIYDYHVHVRGWWDIGYNFVIDRYGRIWEARAGGIDMSVIGAQAGGYNAESTGVAMLGDFMNVVPSSAALGALEQLLAWKLSLHGLPSTGQVTVVVDPKAASYTPFRPGAHVSLPRVAGHRQGDTTSCPGSALYRQLPAIRSRINGLAGTPARITISASPAAASAGSTVSVSGQLTALTGAPIAQASVELQQLGRGGAQTILLTTTDSQGLWHETLTLQRNATLRALHRPFPATLSDWQEIPVAPVITLELVSTSPLQVRGTISPGTPRVTIDVYPAARPHGKPVAHKHLTVANGAFQGTVRHNRSGSFVLIARSRRDSANAAGASAPVPVTVP